MFWLIGFISIGLAVAATGLDSVQSDDERDDEDADFSDHNAVDQNGGDAQSNPEDAEVEPEGGAEASDQYTAEGTSGKDLIFSEAADGIQFSEIYGNDGNDRIYASDGAEVFGGTGNDMIVLRNPDGEGHSVEVSGNEGEDAFLVEAGYLSSHANNTDTITDFHPGEDILGVILEDGEFSDGTVDGSIHYNLKDVTAESCVDGTLLTISIARELDPDSSTSGDESTTDLTHQIFLKGVKNFDPNDVVILEDWVTFAKGFLGPEEYSSVISPE